MASRTYLKSLYKGGVDIIIEQEIDKIKDAARRGDHEYFIETGELTEEAICQFKESFPGCSVLYLRRSTYSQKKLSLEELQEALSEWGTYPKLVLGILVNWT